MEISAKDFLLTLFYSPGKTDSINEPIIGRTRLTKMVFLFEKELKKDFFSDILIILTPVFEPYNYGPFSKDLFDDLSFFISIGLIEAEDTLIPISSAEKIEIARYEDDEWVAARFENDDIEEVEKKYSLSQNGERYVKDKLWSLYSNTQKEILKNFKSQINTISLDTLLKYVYDKYPDMAENSLIKQKYKNKRL